MLSTRISVNFMIDRRDMNKENGFCFYEKNGFYFVIACCDLKI